MCVVVGLKRGRLEQGVIWACQSHFLLPVTLGGEGVKNRPYLICDSESFCAGWCQREISYSTLNYIVLYIYLYYP